MKETENDELTAVMQKLVLKYHEDIMPIAVDMITHLATIFKQVRTVTLQSVRFHCIVFVLQ